MVQNITYREFCPLYYPGAVVALNKIVKDYIEKHGSINRHIDPELVKEKDKAEESRK